MNIKTMSIILAAQICLTGCTFHKEAKQDSVNNTQPLDTVVNDDNKSTDQNTKNDQEIDAGVYKASNLDLSKYNYAIIKDTTHLGYSGSLLKIKQIHLYDNNLIEITVKFDDFDSRLQDEEKQKYDQYGLNYNIEGYTETYLTDISNVVLIDDTDVQRYNDEFDTLDKAYRNAEKQENQNTYSQSNVSNASDNGVYGLG